VSKLSRAGAVIVELRAAGANMACKRLIALMESLGFEVERRGSANHYVVSHPKLSEFSGANFACQHGRAPQVLPSYVRNMRQVVESFAAELDEIEN